MRAEKEGDDPKQNSATEQQKLQRQRRAGNQRRENREREKRPVEGDSKCQVEKKSNKKTSNQRGKQLNNRQQQVNDV